jgi:hypothetical protein
LGAASLAFCGAFALPLVSDLASGRRFLAGSFLPVGFAILVFFAALVVKLPKEAKDVFHLHELEDLIRRALLDVGARNVTINYMNGPQNWRYPRPMVTGQSISISRWVAEEFSPSALIWSVKTDMSASKQFIKKGLIALFALLLLALVAIGLAERSAASGLYALAIFLFVVFGFIAVGYYGFLFQVAADRALTITDSDYAAAKEALSHPYFAQADKPALNRWAFLRAELKGRARRLGIELERGYRAEPRSILPKSAGVSADAKLESRVP